MAQAPVESSMSDHAESSAAMLSRNDDPMTRALRADGSLGLDELVHLNRTASPSHNVPSSLGTLTTTVFSSRQQSNGTKPTSTGTSYPIFDVDGKGKGKASAKYASSLSATHGSGSEAEAEQDNALFGVGDWAADGPLATRRLKGAVRARKRPRINRYPKDKKPVVIIQHENPGHASFWEDEGPTSQQVTGHSSKAAKYFRQRRMRPEHNPLVLAEEGRLSHAVESGLPRKSLSLSLSRARLFVLICLLVGIALTFALSTFAAHYTGKGRIACTKGIIFSATVIITCFTVLAMVVARRAVQEALVAGLLEFLVGFALVIEIDDFM